MGKFQDLMDRELRIRGLAENTRRSYLDKMRRLVRHFMRPPELRCLLRHLRCDRSEIGIRR